MKLGNFFVLSSFLALVYGIPMVLVPETVTQLLGAAPSVDMSITSQLYGVELIAVGLVCWLARKVADPAAQRALILAFLIANTLGLIVSLRGIVLNGAFTVVGVSGVVTYLVLAVGDAYFQFVKLRSS